MTKYESYAARHAKQEPRSHTPNPHSTMKSKSKSIQLLASQDLLDQLDGKASKMDLAILNQRLFQVQNKMGNLTNIVKLVQKYTETQDIQYEKEKKIAVGKESMLNGLIADHQQMMRRQEQYMMEIQQTQRRIKEESLEQTVQEMGERLRKEMNMKIQILVNQIKEGGKSNNSFERMEMDETKERLAKLEAGILKSVTKKEFVKFKDDTNEEMENIVQRFTKLIKKYMSTSSGTPTKSVEDLNSNDKATIDTLSFNKKERAQKSKQQQQRSKPIKINNLGGGETQKMRKPQRDNSEQNIHPNIQLKDNLTPRSKTKSKQKSISKSKNLTLERNISPKLKVSDKRKQKQAQLRQIIKHSKDKKSLR